MRRTILQSLGLIGLLFLIWTSNSLAVDYGELENIRNPLNPPGNDNDYILDIDNLKSNVNTSGNVGVGTTNPNAPLTVIGAGFITGNLGIGITNPQNYALYVSGSEYVTGSIISADQYTVTGNLGAMGNLGIGTTSPIFKVDVRGSSSIFAFTGGNMGIGTTAPNQVLQVVGTVAGTTITGANVTSGADPGHTHGSSSITEADPLAILTDGTRGLSGNWSNAVYNISTLGNVGIGTTNPLTLLDVNQKLNVLSGGNVGIGTTNPIGLLDVRGDLIMNNNALVRGDNSRIEVWNTAGSSRSDFIASRILATTGFEAAAASTYFRTNGTDDQSIVFQARDNGVGFVQVGKLQNADDPYFQIGNLTALYSGNVGIGTTGPTYDLDVQKAGGTSNVALRAYNTSNTAIAAHAIVEASVGGTTSVGDPQLRLTIPGGTSWYIATDNDDGDVLMIGTGTAVGSANLMRLTNSSLAQIGNILLNNGNPTATGSGKGLAAMSSTQLGIFSSASSSGFMTFHTGGTGEKVRIDENGNVGIGTAGPTLPLYVQGAAGGIVRVTDGTVRVDTYVSSSADVPGQIGTNSNHKFGIFTNNQSPSFVIDTSGNVGIGTTGPGSKLMIIASDTAPANNLTIKGTSGARLIIAQPDGGCSSCGVDNAGTAWDCINVTCPNG